MGRRKEVWKGEEERREKKRKIDLPNEKSCAGVRIRLPGCWEIGEEAVPHLLVWSLH